MERLEWNKLLDRYLVENTMSSEEYESLDENQQMVIQELKKSFKRLFKRDYDVLIG